MKLIVRTIKGLEEITIREIKEKYKYNAKKITKGVVYFEAKEVKELRSINSIYELISRFKFKNKTDILKEIKKLEFKIEEDFVVRCNREGNHKFNSLEIEKSIGEIIYKEGNNVNLNSKNIIYVDIVDNYCFVGKLIGRDLCKRNYKLRISQDSVNGCLAYSLLMLADYKQEDVLVDPLCKDGTILIEAGLIKGKKIYGFDNNLYNIKNSEVNSRLAKLKINLIKADLSWLETKFKKNSVNKIVTTIFVHKRNKDDSIKEIKELLHYSKNILKNKLVILSNIDLEKYSNNFKLKDKYNINIGDNLYKIYIFGI
ncbi:hypothetical protein HYX17_00465 [Candidatus Woesearchaeota archaeon]|nr:hypothetical protein [Candidatus Woesearchaeota archaeon]